MGTALKITHIEIHEYQWKLHNAIDANGHVPVPDAPSLGVEIDWGFVKSHRTGLTRYPA